MTLTLIGSFAVKNWFPDAREPQLDCDWHTSSQEEADAFLNGPGCSFIKFQHDVFVHEQLGQWDWGQVATPDELYTLKVSHGFWEVNGPDSWSKHASDIVFLSRKGCQFLRPLYDVVLPVWRERYKRNPTNTRQNARDFFNDAVDRKYDHDSVHASVAYGDEPLYMSVLRDGHEVEVDNAKFDAMAYDAQLKLVREEVYATALERILIPRDYQGSPGAAYHWALRRTATSLFKGEWALFLLLNLDRLMKPDCDYVRRHLDNKHRLRLNGDDNAR